MGSGYAHEESVAERTRVRHRRLGSARLGVELIINPILLVGFGDTLFGIWRVIYQFMGYAWAAGGSSSQALRMVVASEQTIDGIERKQEYVGAAVARCPRRIR